MRSLFKLIIICLLVSLVASFVYTSIDRDNNESETIPEDVIDFDDFEWI